MKKLSLLLVLSLSLGLALTLAACGKGGDSSAADSAGSASGSDSASVAGDASSAVVDSTAAASAPAGAESAAGAAGGAASLTPQAGAADVTNGVMQAAAAPAPVANLAGSYYSYDTERFPDERAPYLELSAEGGFVLHLNLGDNRLGVMTGTYTSTGSGLQMSVMYCDSTDFLGQGTTSLAFSIDGANTLKYTGAPLGMTRTGDSFEREGGMASGGAGGTGQNMYIIAPGRVVSGTSSGTSVSAVVGAAG